MIIKDDFLPKDTLGKLKSYMLSPKVKWHYNEFKVRSNEKTDSFQFVHTFYRLPLAKSRKSPVHDDLVYVEPLLKHLDADLIIKIKANITPRTVEPNKTEFHTDFYDGIGNKTAVYYVNTNNGYTEFESGEIVESVENRMVIFDGDERHRGVSCTDEKVRIIINFNYFP